MQLSDDNLAERMGMRRIRHDGRRAILRTLASGGAADWSELLDIVLAETTGQAWRAAPQALDDKLWQPNFRYAITWADFPKS
jgi:hypothetical protein